MVWVQDDDVGATAEISKREKARLREMQRLKKQKIEEILADQNAAIDADMVCLFLIIQFAFYISSESGAEDARSYEICDFYAE